MSLDLTDRNSLATSLPHGGVVAEVGVAHGEFSQVILEKNEPRELYLVDCWEHQTPEVCGHDPSNASDETQLLIYAEVCKRFESFPQVTVVKEFSTVFASRCANNAFDWVYLDANHLRVREDIEAWWRKIKDGGWLLGHDYTNAGDFINVKTKVDEFVAEYGLQLQVTRGDTDVYEKNYPTWIIRKCKLYYE